jgi:protein-arginine kinase activator protein McsA
VDPVELLRRQLHEAIEHEDFERAAALRDKIHELEGRV